MKLGLKVSSVLFPESTVFKSRQKSSARNMLSLRRNTESITMDRTSRRASNCALMIKFELPVSGRQ